MTNPDQRIVLGATGASGSIYASRLLVHLRRAGLETHLVASGPAEQVFRFERQPLPGATAEGTDGLPGSIVRHEDDNFFAPPSSGSFRHRGMVVVPCSAGTAGRICAGTGETLLLRAADVCLKEGRPLIIVLRETPLSRIHLRNLLELSDAGAKIVPASPGFYHRPSTVEEMVDSVLARVLDLLGIDADISPRWAEND